MEVVLGLILIFMVCAAVRSALQDRAARRAHVQRRASVEAAGATLSALPCELCADADNTPYHTCPGRWDVVEWSWQHHDKYLGRRVDTRVWAGRVFVGDAGRARIRCKHKHRDELGAERCARRMLRRMQVPERTSTIEDLPASEWRRMVAAHGYRCFYCTEVFSLAQLQREHKNPIARGGINRASNIVPACQPCNSLKGTMTDREFRDFIESTRGRPRMRQHRSGAELPFW